MSTDNFQQINLLGHEEQQLRIDRLTTAMKDRGLDLAFITDNANLYYLTGRVFSGYILLSAEGRMDCFVRRPNHLTGSQVHPIRKPEQIAEICRAEGIHINGKTIGYEFNTLSVSDFNRLNKALNGTVPSDLSGALRAARSVKTPREIELIALSGRRQEAVYRQIPTLYRPGMTDLELQIEIERALRRAGCLGQFRISGNSMELFMANLLTGDNADTPSPYDFAMGGAGADPSIPVGANGSEILDGQAVMVDANGNFTGYMTDMTRTFACGTLPPEAMLAHQCSIDICAALSRMARPGTEAAEMYHAALKMADDAGLKDYFMGHRQKAGFVGHGVGIEINEAPVIAPRSADIIAEGNVFALEPKFVIPGVGAVGIENTYAVMPDQTVCLTNAPEEITEL